MPKKTETRSQRITRELRAHFARRRQVRDRLRLTNVYEDVRAEMRDICEVQKMMNDYAEVHGYA